MIYCGFLHESMIFHDDVTFYHGIHHHEKLPPFGEYVFTFSNHPNGGNSKKTDPHVLYDGKTRVLLMLQQSGCTNMLQLFFQGKGIAPIDWNRNTPFTT